MSAMIIAPAAAARQWTDNLGTMTVVSMIMGALSGVGGVFLSASTSDLPTGPIIVIFASGIVFISIFFAPHRGIAWEQVRRRIQNRRLKSEAVLLDLFRLAKTHETLEYPHMEAALRVIHPRTGTLRRQLRGLEEKGLVKMSDNGAWALSQSGIKVCQELMNQHTP